jgi:4-hydroxy-2-oxoheptanedioate aldolase
MAPLQRMQAYAAPSLFQAHRARQAVRDAHEKKIPPLLGYFAAISSVPVTRLLAPMGFDTVWIDWEHTSCNTETMTTMVHDIIFMSQGKTIPFVRVPGHDHASVGYAMDAGASIIFPQVTSLHESTSSCGKY